MKLRAILVGPWGFSRIFDVSDHANPVQIGAFATENALTAPQTEPDPVAGFNLGESYSAHNMEVRGNLVYHSWYTDGIRVVERVFILKHEP